MCVRIHFPCAHTHYIAAALAVRQLMLPIDVFGVRALYTRNGVKERKENETNGERQIEYQRIRVSFRLTRRVFIAAVCALTSTSPLLPALCCFSHLCHFSLSLSLFPSHGAYIRETMCLPNFLPSPPTIPCLLDYDPCVFSMRDIIWSISFAFSFARSLIRPMLAAFTAVPYDKIYYFKPYTHVAALADARTLTHMHVPAEHIRTVYTHAQCVLKLFFILCYIFSNMVLCSLWCTNDFPMENRRATEACNINNQQIPIYPIQ